MRVKGGTVPHRRHKKVLDAAKGYYDRRSKTSRSPNRPSKSEPVCNTRPHNRKRNFRALWIQRINAGVRAIDDTLNYSSSSMVWFLPALKSTVRFLPIWL